MPAIPLRRAISDAISQALSANPTPNSASAANELSANTPPIIDSGLARRLYVSGLSVALR